MASSGAKVGNILALAIGGVLCISAGWETLFYLIGGSGVVWSLVFFLVSSDSPKDHRFIGSREKDFIMEATRKTINAKRICQSHVPWKKIFASKACWSIFIGHFAHNWGNYLFLTQTPSFLRDVLKFDIKSNGLVSTIPYIAAWIAINASSYASDLLSNKISRTLNRRIFSALGLYLPAAFIIGLSFVTCENVALGVALLTLGVATDSSMTGAGYLVNMNDIAGPYSGIIFGISNTFGTLPGLLAPLITGLITKDRTQKQWQLVFIICALVYVILGTIDLILLDANMQPWAIIEDKDEETKKN
jgi:ACS family sodium-dependent inorganic phosphate cotransporter-like MFS transporter 5